MLEKPIVYRIRKATRNGFLDISDTQKINQDEWCWERVGGGEIPLAILRGYL